MKNTANVAVTSGLALFMSVPAFAGGFDRGGVNIDQLFDKERYSGDAGAVYVSPQRRITNVQRAQNIVNPLLPPASTDSIYVEGGYWVPRVGFKLGITDSADCLATYTRPYGADAEYGRNNAYSATAVAFGIETDDYGLTCSYKFQVGKGYFRAIGGVSYQELSGFQTRQTLADGLALGPLFPFNAEGLGRFELSDSAWGWRVGGAYEIPDIAFRASIVYSSKYEYDNLTGTVDISEFGTPVSAAIPVSSISAASEIPQSLEIKVQSGIAQDWLAFGRIKWQDWSRLSIIPIDGVISPVTGRPSNVSFDTFYRDGWTVAGGLAHKFNDQFSGAASITWDRGTSTVSGTQTDTWTFGFGGRYTPNENVEISLGGVMGILTSGSSLPTSPLGGDPANDVTYDFGNDFIGAITFSGKVKF